MVRMGKREDMRVREKGGRDRRQYGLVRGGGEGEVGMVLEELYGRGC